MPITFIEIEKRKTWRIGVFFLILLSMYFLVTLALVQGFLFLLFPVQFLAPQSLSLFSKPVHLVLIFAFALLISAIHFRFSVSGVVQNVMKNLEAIKPDPEDGVHRRLLNIMGEIQVATGGTRKIECFVIPSFSMNALAVQDLRGESAVAITEGLLSRLSRAQTEAVLAHEAYHIISGDCTEATVATSLFGMHASLLEKLQNFGDEERSGLHPAFFLFWLLLTFSQILSMFISREREYRADAASVRMTRNPLAMAEVLHLFRKNWRGAGFIGTGLEMLCITNPEENKNDESEGLFADLMSTHPPIRKRIDVLLKMAHAGIEALERRDTPTNVLANPRDASAGPEFYYARDANALWHGPFRPEELVLLPWVTPLTWVQGGAETPRKASEDEMICRMLKSRSPETASGFVCPICRQVLSEISYERTKVYRCRHCGGSVVENTKIPRIIIRTDMVCSQRIKSLSRSAIADNQRRLSLKRLKGVGKAANPATQCPGCSNPMFRTFYSMAYLVEIDRCSTCGLTWFDKDELEMLQCLIENKITG